MTEDFVSLRVQGSFFVDRIITFSYTLLHVVFENGYMVTKYTLEDVKENVKLTKDLK